MPSVTLSLALQLREAGLAWTPASGDRFAVPGRDMDDEVFVLSDMTVEVHDLPTGRIIGFNGVTEWALDSVDEQDAVWLPSEQQLRERLGATFHRLEVDPAGGFVVTVSTGSVERTHRSDSAIDAYGHALLNELRSRTDGSAQSGSTRGGRWR